MFAFIYTLYFSEECYNYLYLDLSRMEEEGRQQDGELYFCRINEKALKGSEIFFL